MRNKHYKMDDGTVITLKFVADAIPPAPPFEYYIGRTFCFGVIETLTEEEIRKLYDEGYFDSFLTTSSQVRASMKYNKENVKQIKLALNKKTDADIIEILDNCDNVQGYIKDLIRKDKSL